LWEGGSSVRTQIPPDPPFSKGGTHQATQPTHLSTVSKKGGQRGFSSVRRTAVAFLLLLATFALPARTPAQSCGVCGDANGDGLMDVVDALYIAQETVGLRPDLPCPRKADVDRSGGRDIVDALFVAQFTVGLRASLACLVTLSSASPANGETGVAISRETILRFSGPLDPTTITPNAIRAQFGGTQLSPRIHVSPDAQAVTLFYDPPLPASAHVRVTIDGNVARDTHGAPIDPDDDGTPGGQAFVEFDTLTLTTLPGTSVCGRVFASGLMPGDSGSSVNVPLQGVTISVDGAADTMSAVTDAMGNFRLEPAPAGRFFVHINGKTATNGVPPGSYYPIVGKAWESVPGQESNIGNIYLPLVMDGTLQPTSPTEDTTITFPQAILEEFPEFEGVQITIPPGLTRVRPNSPRKHHRAA